MISKVERVRGGCRERSRRLAVLAVGVPVLTVASAGGCFVPTFSDMQSARLAGVDRIEWTPGVSSVRWSEADDHEARDARQSHLGFQVATGIAERVDLRVRFESIRARARGGGLFEQDDAINFVAVGPKIGIIPDALAVSVPVGFTFGGEDWSTWQIDPTLHGTYPVRPWIELNGSAKVLLPTGLGAVNAGLGLSPRPERWILRPEVGMLLDPEGEVYTFQASLGLSVYSGR